MTRGSRATKNTCASTLSAYGIDRSKTRDSRSGGLPTSGANRTAAAAAAPNTATTSAIRARMLGPRKRHHRQMTARMADDVCVDAVERPDGLRSEDRFGRTVRDDPPGLEQRELGAERRREIQIVRRHDHRHAARAIEIRETRRDLALKPAIARRR